MCTLCMHLSISSSSWFSFKVLSFSRSLHLHINLELYFKLSISLTFYLIVLNSNLSLRSSFSCTLRWESCLAVPLCSFLVFFHFYFRVRWVRCYLIHGLAMCFLWNWKEVVKSADEASRQLSSGPLFKMCEERCLHSVMMMMIVMILTRMIISLKFQNLYVQKCIQSRISTRSPKDLWFSSNNNQNEIDDDDDCSVLMFVIAWVQWRWLLCRAALMFVIAWWRW